MGDDPAVTARLIDTAMSMLNDQPVSHGDLDRLITAEDGAFLSWVEHHRVGALLERKAEAFTGSPPAANRLNSAQVAESIDRAEALRVIGYEIADQFQASDIQYVVLKGVSLLETIYARQPVRPMADIDILIRRKDLKKSVEALRKLGFHHATTELPLWSIKRFHYETAFRRNGSEVDLHWDIDHALSSYSIPVFEMFEDAITVTTGQGSFKAPSPESMLLHLILHVERSYNLAMLYHPAQPQVSRSYYSFEPGQPNLIHLYDIVCVLNQNRTRFLKHGNLENLIDRYNLAVPAFLVLNLCAEAFPALMREWQELLKSLEAPDENRLGRVIRSAAVRLGDRSIAGLNLRPVRFLELVNIMLATGNSERRGSRALAAIAMPLRIIDVLRQVSWGGAWIALGIAMRSISGLPGMQRR